MRLAPGHGGIRVGDVASRLGCRDARGARRRAPWRLGEQPRPDGEQHAEDEEGLEEAERVVEEDRRDVARRSPPRSRTRAPRARRSAAWVNGEAQQHDRRHQQERGEPDHAERARLHQRAEELVVEDEGVRLVADHDAASEAAAEERAAWPPLATPVRGPRGVPHRPCRPRCTATRPARRRRGTRAACVSKTFGSTDRGEQHHAGTRARTAPQPARVEDERHEEHDAEHDDGGARDRRQHAAEQQHDRRARRRSCG